MTVAADEEQVIVGEYADTLFAQLKSDVFLRTSPSATDINYTKIVDRDTIVRCLAFTRNSAGGEYIYVLPANGGKAERAGFVAAAKLRYVKQRQHTALNGDDPAAWEEIGEQDITKISYTYERVSQNYRELLGDAILYSAPSVESEPDEWRPLPKGTHVLLLSISSYVSEGNDTFYFVATRLPSDNGKDDTYMGFVLKDVLAP
jgi:hypothetical protein